MVAFNFTVYIDKVESGKKRRTIRQKRRAKVGDKLQLYTGMMDKNCRKLRDAICTNVERVEFSDHGVFVGDFAGRQLRDDDADEFARLDGFRDYVDMLAWFKKTYPKKQLPFEMYLHEWEPV